MLARSLPMFPSPPFPHPTRLGERHYVLVVKDFLGELDALMQAAATDHSVWERVTPLIEVGMKNKGTNEAPRSSRLPGLPTALAHTFHGSPFFLDFNGVSARQRIKVGTGALRRSVLAVDDTIQECLTKALNFIPVFHPGLNKRLSSLFREVSGEGRGTCIRLRVTGTIPSDGFGAEIHSLMDLTQTTPSTTDVIVDLGYMPPQPGYGPRHIADLLAEIAQIGAWRSLVLISTVVPENHAGFPEDFITTIKRQDWELWNTIRHIGDGRVPTFGDYGVQHPKSPSGSPHGMRAYIRWSTANILLVVRGTELVKNGRYDNEQYRQIAQQLSDHAEFRVISEGDRLILECANGNGSPGDQRRWRGASTNHHVSEMPLAIAGLPESPAERAYTGASPLHRDITV